jgi:hypothetical protein
MQAVRLSRVRPVDGRPGPRQAGAMPPGTGGTSALAWEVGARTSREVLPCNRQPAAQEPHSYNCSFVTGVPVKLFAWFHGTSYQQG